MLFAKLLPKEIEIAVDVNTQEHWIKLIQENKQLKEVEIVEQKDNDGNGKKPELIETKASSM